MIVYVETNFVLEIVLAQEQHIAAETILAMAEMQKLELAFPSFIISEVYSTIVRRQKERKGLLNSFQETLKQIKRSEHLKDTALSMEPLVSRLLDAETPENDLLYNTIQKMLSVGHSIESDLQSLVEARSYQLDYDLFLPDSIIYATIINDLKKRPENEAKRFLSKDIKAFSGSRVKADLRRYKCIYFPNFDNALENIKALQGKDNVS